MRTSCISVVSVLLALPSSLAHADGMFCKLPRDGTWATYRVDASEEGKGEREKGTLRMASVGQVKEGGQACRWIEIVMEGQRDGKPSPSNKVVLKALIPEKFLAKGETPLDHALRAWERKGEKGQPQKMNDLKPSLLSWFLSGPLKDAKPLPKTDVQSKLGKLLCEGVTGSVEFMEGDNTFSCVLENRLHENAPFGIVGSRAKVKFGPLNIQYDFKLVDFGDNARSEIRDGK